VTQRPLRAGLDLVRGSVSLILLRVLLVLLAALPALLLTLGGLATGPARQPYFTDVQGRLPLFHLSRLMDALPSGLMAVALLATALTLLGEQLLVAGGLAWLAPDRLSHGSGEAAGKVPSAWRTILAHGLGWLWPMLKVLALAAVTSGLGLLVIRWGFDHLTRHGEVAGYSGLALRVRLPALQALLGLLWVALSGAWAFWCRVVLVADGRRTVRSAWLLAMRVMWRHPLRGPLFYVLVTLLAQLGSGAVLAVWRQTPPTGVGGALLWSGTWVLALVLAAFLWHWLLRAGRLLYAQPALADLRAQSDGPIGVWAALRRLVSHVWSRARKTRRGG